MAKHPPKENLDSWTTRHIKNFIWTPSQASPSTTKRISALVPGGNTASSSVEGREVKRPRGVRELKSIDREGTVGLVLFTRCGAAERTLQFNVAQVEGALSIIVELEVTGIEAAEDTVILYDSEEVTVGHTISKEHEETTLILGGGIKVDNDSVRLSSIASRGGHVTVATVEVGGAALLCV